MVTTTAACPVCAATFTPVRRQRFCSPACRQAGWRSRHQQPAAQQAIDTAAPRGASRRSITVYACTECETRYLAEQWCPDCNRPCRRVGTGGLCPCCDEPITIDELLDQHQNQPASAG